MWLTPHSISSPTLHVSLELNFLKDRNNIFFKVKFSLSQRTQKAKNEDNNPSSQRPGSVSFPRGNHPQRFVFVLSVVTFTPIYGDRSYFLELILPLTLILSSCAPVHTHRPLQGYKCSIHFLSWGSKCHLPYPTWGDCNSPSSHPVPRKLNSDYEGR